MKKFFRMSIYKCFNCLGHDSLPSLLIIEPRISLEICVSSTLEDTLDSLSQRCFYKSRKSSSLSLKILQLILLLGSVSLLLEPNPSLSVFLSAFINGPHILSLTKKISMNYALSIGFYFTSFSLSYQSISNIH